MVSTKPWYPTIAASLGWYVVSIGWIRYAFAGLAISSLFVSRFFLDVTENFRVLEYGQKLWALVRGKEEGDLPQLALRATLALWLVGMIALPLAQNLKNIALTRENAAADMANYLNENIPAETVIETWEPEIGFLADQQFHYPPSGTLNLSVQQKFMNGPLVAEQYNFQEHVDAEYVLVGNFATWIELYTPTELKPTYQQEAQFGPYILYKRQ